jgi:bifunctional enzyme CysN/CysC
MQQEKDLLRIVICGSVASQKLAVIQHLMRDEVDLIKAEPTQGIAIEVAYRSFSSQRRRFILANALTQQAHVRHMVMATSTAQLAILIVDDGVGNVAEIHRHMSLLSMMGVRDVVLAVDQKNSAQLNERTLQQWQSDLPEFASSPGFRSIVTIPICALEGDNIRSHSARLPWYQGPPLFDYLDAFTIYRGDSQRLVFPVQWVTQTSHGLRGLCGSIAEGQVRVGDQIRVTASGNVASVAEILTKDGPLSSAQTGDSIDLRLDCDIDITQGDVITHAQSPLETTEHFEATLIWMDEAVSLTGRNYHIMLATQWAIASITSIKYGIDIENLKQKPCKKQEINTIMVCNIVLNRPLAFDTYEKSREMGGFTLVDPINRATVACGMIRHTLRRSQNIHKQSLTISRIHREALNGHRGKVVWFTGLSGSGKSTLANALEVALHQQGVRTYILDGDNIRQGLNKDIGFTEEDRVENIRRVAEVAKLMMDAGLIVLAAFISPFRREREMARELIGSDNFIEVYVDTPLHICEQRDVKGLYKKAREGKIPNMTGINSPYEAPQTPEYRAGSESLLLSVSELTQLIVS